MAFKKYVRKQVKKGKKALRKRYTKKGGTPKMGKIVRDVARLSRALNVEKKSFTITPITQVVGQVQGNATGCIVVDITPSPAQGVSNTQITGNSFKLTGAYIEMQLTQQSKLLTNAFYIFEIWDNKGVPISNLSNVLNYLFNVSTFTGIVDSYSTRNQDSFNDFRCIKRWYMAFPQDSISGTTQVRTKQMPLKMNKHIRLDSSANIKNGQMFLTVRSNYGNCSTGTLSTLSNVATTAVDTGATLLYTTKYWFVDN